MSQQTEPRFKFTPHNLLPTMSYFGGAFYTANQPGMGFWDGVVWLWYFGRFIAAHFTQF